MARRFFESLMSVSNHAQMLNSALHCINQNGLGAIKFILPPMIRSEVAPSVPDKVTDKVMTDEYGIRIVPNSRGAFELHPSTALRAADETKCMCV